ncbi:PD-(D/E)XK nuclease family protein [Actinoplanes sp. NPDC024001]|uniref:RecB family exonuclease n=1 Tax=Actinoplanes sp. NPDC024001 TaxID=3154598 RepID=UPI003405DF39
MIPAARRRPETPAGPSLSPSRAADFKTCPLLFRFRTIDKLPETPSADQVRGTLVHAVLERLFDLPAAERTPEAAVALVAPEWERLLEQEPALADLFADPPAGAPSRSVGAPSRSTDDPSRSAVDPSRPTSDPSLPAGDPSLLVGDPSLLVGDLSLPAGDPSRTTGDPSRLTGDSPRRAVVTRDPAAVAAEADATGQATLVDIPGGAEAARIAAFLSGAGNLLTGYFAVEDPQRLQPAEREALISTVIGDELLLRGYIDRLDVSPAGDLRVVDYKTGGAPREAFEGRALFQLKFYALVLWRTRGVVPRVLRLLYLKDAEVCDYSPEAGELERFERTLVALSEAIERAKRDRDFRPKPSRLCGWCNHQALCPEFGGTPPPFPEPATSGAVSAEPEPDRLATMLRDGPLG